ncbi:MAG: hypothetical protein OXE58_06550 [Acidobacteria bacterium]|nr:hypothetical protein [Acidobacteriota bacterium]
MKMLNERGGRGRSGDSALPEMDPALAGLVDDWVSGVDAVAVGGAAGMQRPVAWPEMLLLPSRASGR